MFSFDSSCSSSYQLSSARSSLIPQHIRHTLITNTTDTSLAFHPRDHSSLSNSDRPPLSAPVSHAESWRYPLHGRTNSHTFSNFDRSASRLSEPIAGYDDEDEQQATDESYDDTIRNSLPPAPYSAPITRKASVMPSPMHAIATPKPNLLFAIASDDVEQVKRVLESGDAGPNDQVGPQSALAFTLTNDKLQHKMEIVKSLLAFGADPSALNNPELNPPQRIAGEAEATAPITTLLEGMDPATRCVCSTPPLR